MTDIIEPASSAARVFCFILMFSERPGHVVLQSKREDARS